MGKLRIPLAVPFESRDGSVMGKDSFIANGYVDTNKDGAKYAYRRPGGALWYNPAVANFAQGQFYFNGLEYVIINDTLIRTSGASLSGSSGGTAVNMSPQWAARFKHIMLTFNDRMWVICGQLQSGTLANDVWSSQDGVTWALQTSTAASAGARVGLGGCVFNNAMWIMGGFQGATVYNDVWTSTDGTNWTNVVKQGTAGMWPARYDFGCVAANNGIYVYGGSNAAAATLNDVWFTSDGVTWVQIAVVTPFTVRSGASCLFFNNKLWVIGGASSPGVYYNDVWSSPDGVTWTQITAAAFASARGFMAACVYNNKMWVISGVAGGTEIPDVYSSPDGITWTLVTTTPGFSGRQSAAATVFKTPSTINQFQYETMWLSGGVQLLTAKQENYRFTLDVSTSSSYALSPTVSGQFYQFSTFNNGTQLLLKNQSNFWILQAGTLIKVTDPNYPPQTVPGLVVLNDFAYVMTPSAEIHACKIFDASKWPSLQFIVANFEDDKGTGLAKYLNYVVAFGTYTIQYFYDAGNPPPGVSIAPYINANQKVGMVGQNASGLDGHPTFANIGNTVVFLGQTQQGDQGIYMLNGMIPQKISDSQVERVLAVDSSATIPELIWTASADTGHNFVIVNLNVGAYAMVYDLESKQWYVWASAVAGYNNSFFYYGNFVIDEAQGNTLWIGGNPGEIWRVSVGIFTDNGQIIDMIIQTQKFDGGTMQKKFFGIVDLVCGQTGANSNMLLNWTDDDYVNFSPQVLLNTGLSRPRANRLGAARRRAFRLECQDTIQRQQFEALEITLSEGES